MTHPPGDKTDRFVKHLEPLQGVLEAFCRRSLRDRNDVADVLQSAVANAFRDFDLYAEGTNFRAWIFRYVSFEVLNRNRGAARRTTVELPPELPAAPGGHASWIDDTAMDRLLEAPEIVLDECDEALSRAVLELSEMERGIFLLRAIGEFKYREIAEILEVPMGTVMGLLSRSRDRLRCSLFDYARTHGLLPGRDSE